jgi:ribosomal protein S18 acetylase RimI-like enzyme
MAAGWAGLRGRVVASTTVTTYGTRIAWIGMVLVDEAARRQGIGQRMLGHAETYLSERGVETVALDATPAGIPLYERLGYRARYGLERWRGIVADAATLDEQAAASVDAAPPPRASTSPAYSPRAPGQATDADVRPMRATDLPAVAAFDLQAFGTDRARILRALFEGHPGDCVVAERHGALGGYALSRPGARAWHLGPLVAEDAITADRLAGAALQRHRGTEVVMDIVSSNRAAVALAGRLGLTPVRPFTRMSRGAPPREPDLGRLYTSAGPEIG